MIIKHNSKNNYKFHKHNGYQNAVLYNGGQIFFAVLCNNKNSLQNISNRLHKITKMIKIIQGLLVQMNRNLFKKTITNKILVNVQNIKNKINYFERHKGALENLIKKKDRMLPQ